jgi:hypothetical protein
MVQLSELLPKSCLKIDLVLIILSQEFKSSFPKSNLTSTNFMLKAVETKLCL